MYETIEVMTGPGDWAVALAVAVALGLLLGLAGYQVAAEWARIEERRRATRVLAGALDDHLRALISDLGNA